MLARLAVLIVRNFLEADFLGVWVVQGGLSTITRSEKAPISFGLQRRVRLQPGLVLSQGLGLHLRLELAVPWPMIPSSLFLPLPMT
jgi:hypothetical protein